MKKLKGFNNTPYTTGCKFLPVINEGGNYTTTFIFRDDISTDSITKLILDIEDIRQNNYSNLNLFFSSVGGEVSEMKNLATYLNSIEDMHIRIVANDELSSAGFMVMFEIDNDNIEIQIDDQCICMVHLPSFRIETRDLLKNTSGCYKEQGTFMLHKNNYIEKFTELLTIAGMEEDKIESVLCGEEVFLYGAEMKRYLINYFSHLEKVKIQQEIDYHKQEIADLESLLVGETTEEIVPVEVEPIEIKEEEIVPVEIGEEITNG